MTERDELFAELKELRERIDAIEQRLRTESPRVSPAPTPVAAPLPAEGKHPHPHPSSRELETSFGLTWINRIGVITLLLGAGFFFKYAVENLWIGPAARVVLGVAAGALALAGGDLLYRRSQRAFAQGISGLGIALLYLSFYAAYEFYHLIGNVLALGLLTAVTAGGAALALHYEALPVAALGLFGGYLTPVLVRPALWVVYGYTLLLDAAAMALAKARNWRPLEVLALAATTLLVATSPARKEPFLGGVFVGAYYALFAVARIPAVRIAAQPLAAVALAVIWIDVPSGYLLCSLALSAAGLVLIRPPVALASYWLGYAVWSVGADVRPEGPTFVAITLVFLVFFAWSQWRPPEFVVTALNGPTYFAAAYLLLDRSHHGWMGLLAVALAGMHLAAARRLLALDRRSALLATGLGAAFVTIAVPVQFAGYTITIAWAMEAAALAWIALRFAESRAAWVSAGILALVLIRLAAFDRELSAPTVVTNARFVTFAASAVAFWLIAKWMPRGRAAIAVYVTGHAILAWALGMEIESWAWRTILPEDSASVITAGVSIMLAAYAVVLVAAGVLAGMAVNRLLGLALIGVVVVKLYLYDVWLLGRLYRTVAFVALGALLVLSSYLYSRYRDRVENWWREQG